MFNIIVIMPVRTSFIKKLAESLIAKFPDVWTNNFEENKQLVQKLTNIESKTVRNQVAGYITSIIERKRKYEPWLFKNDNSKN